MKPFLKNMTRYSLASALSFSLANISIAATYEVIDKGSVDTIEYTYGKRQNNQGVMAITGANAYNFPVQFDYLDDTDYYNIGLNSLQYHDNYFGLEPILDIEPMSEGNPSANDLAWIKIYLQSLNSSSTNPYFQYQIVGDVIAMTNTGAGEQTTELCIFDTDFDGNPCTGTLTRSTVDNIEGVTNKGIAYGNGTAPYLPMEPYTNDSGDIQQHWLRAHAARGFFSPDYGQTIYSVPPIESSYGGGISTIFDMNENDVAVGYSSYKLSEGREEAILDEDTGCTEPNIPDVPYDICIQYNLGDMYHIQAFKASLSPEGEVETELLGLLVNPHEDDIRAFSSQALAINNNGVAVGYAHGWYAGKVENPTVDQFVAGTYAVMFREGKVYDFNQLHTAYFGVSNYAYSSANDINDNGLAVGHTLQASPLIKKFFYVDTTVPESEMEMIIPGGFFSTSVSTAYAVNSLGVIVGEAEIESHNASSQNPRRTTGFMYDTSSDTPEMIDVNDLLECQSAYNVIKANSINDEGQISATAVVKENSYDAKGQLILDESGNPTEIDVVRAVLLNPIAGGELEDCSETEEKVERQGASTTYLILFSLIFILILKTRQLNTQYNS